MSKIAISVAVPTTTSKESATLSYRNAHWTAAGIVCEEETSSSLVKIAKVCCNTITYYVEDKVNKRPRWSPDGSKAVFSRGDTTLSTRDIYEYDTSPGGGLSVVFEDPGGTLVEKVLYVKRDQATSERQIFKLTRPPFSASSPEAIDLLLSDATFTDNNAPSWAPNEDAIVWQRSSGSPLLNRLWIIDSTMP